MEKKIITMGTALALALSMGMTVSAGHHGTCAGRVIQGSGLCQYRGSHEGGHHLFCYGGGQDCAYWGIDVSGVCDNWEYCHGGDGAAQGANTAAGSQPAAGAATESQPQAATAAQAQPQAVYGFDGAAYGTGSPYYGGNGGYGGHHREWNGCSGSYGGGCHGSGHHGRSHH